VKVDTGSTSSRKSTEDGLSPLTVPAVALPPATVAVNALDSQLPGATVIGSHQSTEDLTWDPSRLLGLAPAFDKDNPAANSRTRFSVVSEEPEKSSGLVDNGDSSPGGEDAQLPKELEASSWTVVSPVPQHGKTVKVPPHPCPKAKAAISRNASTNATAVPKNKPIPVDALANSTGADLAFKSAVGALANSTGADLAFKSAVGALANSTGADLAFKSAVDALANSTGADLAFKSAVGALANSTGADLAFKSPVAALANSTGADLAFKQVFGNISFTTAQPEAATSVSKPCEHGKAKSDLLLHEEDLLRKALQVAENSQRNADEAWKVLHNMEKMVQGDADTEAGCNNATKNTSAPKRNIDQVFSDELTTGHSTTTTTPCATAKSESHSTTTTTPCATAKSESTTTTETVQDVIFDIPAKEIQRRVEAQEEKAVEKEEAGENAELPPQPCPR